MLYNEAEGDDGTSSCVDIDRESDVSWKSLIGNTCENHSGAVTLKTIVSVAVSLR